MWLSIYWKKTRSGLGRKWVLTVIFLIVAFSLAWYMPITRRGLVRASYWLLTRDRSYTEAQLVNHPALADLLVTDEAKPLMVGGRGEWDETVREIGNIVYAEKYGLYYFYYSGHWGQASNYRKSNVYVGVATSRDGINWEKQGKALEVEAEDPYVVIDGDNFYMFYEDKTGKPISYNSRTIDVATSSDGINFATIKKAVISPTHDKWQSGCVSSPLVVKGESEWLMFYEGRGPNNENGHHGWIGIATSSDLINWKMEDKPVLTGSYRWPWDNWLKWDNYVVPDDIVKFGDDYILSYHALGHKRLWQTGLAVSRNLRDWKKLHDLPIHPAETTMMNMRSGNLEFVIATNHEVRNYRAVKLVKTNNKITGTSWRNMLDIQ